MTEEQFYEWFHRCGYDRTGKGTAISEEWMNEHGHKIIVPRPSVLSPEDRKEATEGMSRYFRWRSEWGAH